MRINARSQVVAILAVLTTLLLGSSALAEDHGVDFGVKTDAGKDAGSLMCRLNKRVLESWNR